MHRNVTLSSTKFGPEAFFFRSGGHHHLFAAFLEQFLGCSVVALIVLQLFSGAIKDVDDG